MDKIHIISPRTSTDRRKGHGRERWVKAGKWDMHILKESGEAICILITVMSKCIFTTLLWSKLFVTYWGKTGRE